ncbi:hypothetical protein [Rubellimicrobium arenae]|uniref:hypothetical protein n=1 Tax=Rubellimicrobium arenae TaxID=2817372 RepID=UPI001B301692|nr:hypothetical protein [Rubellimicrobium arenae]
MWWTLAAALVASATTLLVAFLAYRYQKEQDRRLQLQSERRKVYDGFFAATTDYYLALRIALRDSDHAAEVLENGSRYHFALLRSQESLAYYGEKPVIDQCFRYVACLDILRSHIRAKMGLGQLSVPARQAESLREAFTFCRDARIRSLAEARADAFGIPLQTARTQLAGIFPLDGDADG